MILVDNTLTDVFAIIVIVIEGKVSGGKRVTRVISVSRERKRMTNDVRAQVLDTRMLRSQI